MKVLIIEDELYAAEKLISMLNNIAPNLQIISTITNIKDAVKFLSQNTVDLIFLDIQLEDGISFQIFEQFEINTPIIFTTAYDEYAIKAFDLNSISYLLKPIKKEKLENAVKKYRNSQINSININEIKNLLHKKEYKSRFIINVGMKIKSIKSEEIAYFFAHEKFVYLMTFEGDKYDIDKTLETLSNDLDPKKFFKINRKFIVNISSIRQMYSLSRSRIKLELKPEVPFGIEAIVSIDNSNNFKEWLDN